MMDPMKALDKIWAILQKPIPGFTALDEIAEVVKPFADAKFLNVEEKKEFIRWPTPQEQIEEQKRLKENKDDGIPSDK